MNQELKVQALQRKSEMLYAIRDKLEERFETILARIDKRIDRNDDRLEKLLEQD